MNANPSPQAAYTPLDEHRRMLRLQIGDDGMIDVLMTLPDSYFGLTAAQQADVFSRMVHHVNRGVTDTVKLVSLGMSVLEPASVNA